MYLSIVLLVMLHMITNSRNVYLIYLPNFLNIIVIFLSTPVQDYRYLYANILVFYLLVIIIVGEYYKKRSVPSVNLNNYGSVENSHENSHSVQNELNHEYNGQEIYSNSYEETPEEMEARIRAKILKEFEDNK